MEWGALFSDPNPIGSMYGIYSNIGGILMVNVTIYTIHGSYGNVINLGKLLTMNCAYKTACWLTYPSEK